MMMLDNGKRAPEAVWPMPTAAQEEALRETSVAGSCPCVTPPNCQRTSDERVAHARLSKFFERTARAICRASGLNYEESEVYPQDFEALTYEVTMAQRYFRPVRVKRAVSELNEFSGKEAVWALRFWNTYLHVRYSLGYTYMEKMDVADRMCSAVVDEFGLAALEAKIMYRHTALRHKLARSLGLADSFYVLG